MYIQTYYVNDMYIIMGLAVAGMIGGIFFAMWLGTKYN